MSTMDGKRDIPRQDYFASVKAMFIVFRAKLREQFQKRRIAPEIDPSVWSRGFNVHCQAMNSSQHSIPYLAPYVFKVVVADSRIIKVENDHVFFRTVFSSPRPLPSSSFATYHPYTSSLLSIHTG